ncbi:MAG: glycosyltransferase family 39 protein [Elusimicrobia bacterium]|nr:glycosyltransferase family 39 protein [Elusimicrobiota bacterium]
MTSILRELRLPGAPRWMLALLVLVATAPFWDLGHPLVEVDDARYAEVPREMLASGDWATPRLNEMDYVEKPPLWYWLCAASYGVFGVNEAAARLPLALLALLALLGTAWLGSWLYEPRTGWTAAAILGSCGLFFGLSHIITPDMGLTVWLLWCSAFLLRALLRPEDAAWAAPAAWACAALAVLSKGLVGFVFPAAWSAALWLILPEARGRFKALLRPLGPVLFVLIAAPWFVLMERRHPGFLRFFFYEHHFQRFATNKFNRASPWYFFIAFLPVGLLPWTLPVAEGLRRTWANRDRAGLALAAWALLITAFFSRSQSKLVTYILPVFPHLALLGARACVESPPAWLRRASLILGAVLSAAALLAVPAAPGLEKAIMVPTANLAWLAAAALAALGGGILCCGLGRRPVAAGCLAGLLAGGAALAGMRAAEDNLSARPIAEAINPRLAAGDLIYAYGTYLHGLPYYTRRRVDRMLNWKGELEYAGRDPAVAEARFGGENAVAPLPPPGRRAFLVCRDRDASYVLSLSPPAAVRRARRFGRWVLVEY